MYRRAFALGLFAIGGQILLLREIVASLHGDEIFIGLSLFGWMMAVALGSLFGRKLSLLPSSSAILAGLILLPISIILIRLAPLFFSTSPGVYLPFYLSAIIAIAGLIPVGLISGLGFSLICYEGHRPAASIARTYLFEGLGAFAGGILIRMLVGPTMPGLAMSLAIGILILCIIYVRKLNYRTLALLAFGLVLIIAAMFKAPIFDRQLQSLKYPVYDIIETFDTRYSRQTILRRDNQTVLVTNNQIEAVFPDIESNEYLLLPGLAYLNDTGNTKALFVGRPEFGLAGLAKQIDRVSLDCYDPRKGLSEKLGEIGFGDNVRSNLFETDLLGSINSGNSIITRYDLITLYFSSFDSYESSRYLLAENIDALKGLLSHRGILQITFDIDTDRHISFGKETLLSAIYNHFKGEFNNFCFWPGNRTIFLFSNEVDLNLDYEKLVARLNDFSYSPQYVNDHYLFDKFNPLRMERLEAQLGEEGTGLASSIILHYQLTLNLTLDKIDSLVFASLLRPNYGPLGTVAIILIVFITALLSRRQRRGYSVFLYFIAGFVSITLELISFYLYQSQKGILFNDISILISIFMLGLAIGTYYSGKLNKENLEFPSILLLLSAAFIFYMTYNTISVGLLLLYHSAFLFVVALATGSLFVAATDRYYFGRSQANRGVGYAFEIGGSALGALTATTILLPIIGLPTLIISIIVLLVVTLAGAILTVNK